MFSQRAIPVQLLFWYVYTQITSSTSQEATMGEIAFGKRHEMIATDSKAALKKAAEAFSIETFCNM